MKFEYRHKMMIAAHRGNCKYFPENTMASFRSALEYDIDMIETDVHATKDGELVLVHDHSVDRCTDGEGQIKDLTLAQIKSLDAGSWKGEEFKGERVPTFREFLDLVKDRKEILLNIELKDYPNLQGDRAYASCDKTIAMIEEYGMAERTVFNSWNGMLLEYIDKKYGHKYRLHGYYPIKHLGEGLTRDPYEYLYCACIFDGNKGVPKKESFDYLLNRGVEPWVGSSEDPEFFRAVVEMGAVLATVNDPKRAIEILEELKLR